MHSKPSLRAPRPNPSQAVAVRPLPLDRLKKLVHVAKRELHMDDEAYRAVLLQVTGKRSTADMTLAELDRVMSHMKRCGFKVRQQPRPSRALDQQPESRKIRALWILLHELDAVQNRSETALAAYVKRMTGVDALQWTDARQSERVIESLKKWAVRFLPDQLRARADRLDAAAIDPAVLERLNKALALAFSRRTFDPMLHAWELLHQVASARGVPNG